MGKKGIKIKREQLMNLLDRCHLGGLIKECLIQVEKGKAIIEAIDMTNSIAMSTSAQIGRKNLSGKFGISNIEILSKFLSSIDEKKLFIKQKDDRSIRISRKDSRRSGLFLLTSPDLIVTTPESKEPLAKAFEDKMTIRAELTATTIKDLQAYINLVGSRQVTISFNEDGIDFVCGGSNENNFSVKLSSEIENDDAKELEIVVNGEHLAKILSVINYEDDNPPEMHAAGEDFPVMIKTQEAFWALTPIEEE